ncbi:hypothetical protein PGT21_002004 [Puccinia graminis f. sp. tritici]|uniref:Uncharacterized protein n=1 Tax=Puccinia graminis f. sp. tritici TaxID=56615 RepID=A0A5B0LSD0_PUCGR|nr:hypothetical protein PGT21_002004 [Puccinia graminis f. sp. tritici]
MTLKSVTKIIKLLGIEHNDCTVAGAMRATKKSGWAGNFTRSSRQISLACRSRLSYPTFRTGRWQLQYVEPHQFLLRCYELQDGRYARGIGSALSPLGGIWKGMAVTCTAPGSSRHCKPRLSGELVAVPLAMSVENFKLFSAEFRKEGSVKPSRNLKQSDALFHELWKGFEFYEFASSACMYKFNLFL